VIHTTTAHTIPQRPPIRVAHGQQVRAGQQDTDWPAFVFITTDDGAEMGPERYLDTSSDPAAVLTAYDTIEPGSLDHLCARRLLRFPGAARTTLSNGCSIAPARPQGIVAVDT
jgi:hypothetical protein